MMETSLPQRLQQLERRIQELENGAEPCERDRLRNLLQTVLELHGAGLTRLLELIADAGQTGRQILQDAEQDELVRSLLVLHGLQAQDLESRVGQALDQVRPFLHSQGADVELTAIADDAVRLHLRQGEGCYPATMQTLRAAIEEAICALAPDVYHIEFVDGPARLPLPVI
jgi:Fe-S cluster biogenesis protein NfuA